MVDLVDQTWAMTKFVLFIETFHIFNVHYFQEKFLLVDTIISLPPPPQKKKKTKKDMVSSGRFE